MFACWLSTVRWALLLLVLHLIFFQVSGWPRFAIVAFPRYLHLYFYLYLTNAIYCIETQLAKRTILPYVGHEQSIIVSKMSSKNHNHRTWSTNYIKRNNKQTKINSKDKQTNLPQQGHHNVRQNSLITK